MSILALQDRKGPVLFWADFRNLPRNKIQELRNCSVRICFISHKLINLLGNMVAIYMTSVVLLFNGVSWICAILRRCEFWR